MINKIHNENCLDTMFKMPDNFIDLTVTSPPYDDLRTYNGYSFDFENIAKELYRVTKEGGVVVWVVTDKTDKGSETLTSFKQCIYFKECGFNVHDTMIYAKNNIPVYDPRNKRYKNGFEFMFVLSKGKVKTYNPIKDVLSKKTHANGVTKRNPNGEMRKPKDVVLGEYQDRSSVWGYNNGFMQTTKDKIAFKHPAIFPEQLANDHIISWSNENDLIYDPFAGSGTTAKMSILNKRNWIASEISLEYCEIIKERIKIL
jgi:DNA modification methylase